MSNKHIISDCTARHKGRLVLGNQLLHKRLQAASDDLRVDFVVDVAQCDWPVIRDFLGFGDLWDKANVSIIDIVRQ